MRGRRRGRLRCAPKRAHLGKEGCRERHRHAVEWGARGGAGTFLLPRHIWVFITSFESFVLRVLIWRAQGRISIEYISAFQMCPFKVMVGASAGGH